MTDSEIKIRFHSAPSVMCSQLTELVIALQTLKWFCLQSLVIWGAHLEQVDLAAWHCAAQDASEENVAVGC